MFGNKYPEFLVLVSGVSGGKGKEKIKMESNTDAITQALPHTA